MVDLVVGLVASGFGEEEVLNMPLNKVLLYADAVGRRTVNARKQFVSDVTNSIGIALSGKGFKAYIEELGE